MLSLKEIYEATAEQDKKFRSESVSFLNKLINFFKHQAIEKIMDHIHILQSGPYKDSFYMDVNFLDKKYNGLRIIFGPQNQEMGGALGWRGTEKREPVLFLFILSYKYDVKKLKENDIRNIGLELENDRQTFIHEFTHYLDSLRWKTDMDVAAQKSNIASSTQQDYYNSPAELNAYYQQAISQLEKNINLMASNKNGKSYLKRSIPDNPQQFIKVAKNGLFHRPFIKNLSPENTKRLDKRLYNLWMDIKHLRD